ncbi:MAG TPA: hypothetical protein VF173_08785 [Thermoanaerobaculia bacterium]|nr:hypothetical protein [Thermoanaerobaculia bacterium]
MTAIELLAFDSNGGALQGHPLDLAGPGSSCSLRLRSLPGASGVHLALTNGAGVLLRAEVAAESDEWVEVAIEWDAGGRWTVASAGRPVLQLPVEDANAPLPPLRPAYRARQLDVALLVDGTTRDGTTALLANRERWRAHTDQLVALTGGLAEAMKADLRVAVIAFGDRPVPAASAPDLKPAYHLDPAEPEERTLRPIDAGQLHSRLLSLRPTSGGDFVDALADALAACRGLRWRNGARKLLVATGDSPGYSIRRPAPWGGDAQVRENDVDVEAAALHRQGIEILTLYHAPTVDAATFEFVRPFVEHARMQYLRLASRPGLCFEAGELDPAAVVRALTDRVSALGRGASPGILGGSGRGRRDRR